MVLQATPCLRQCCQLPLANNADIMNSLLFRSASGSFGFLSVLVLLILISGTSAMALSLLFFLCSPLRTSLASASFEHLISAPCGMVLRHFSIRILKRSGCACGHSSSLIALQHGHPLIGQIWCDHPTPPQQRVREDANARQRETANMPPN